MRVKLPKLNTVVCRTPCTSACQLVVVDYYIQDKMVKLFVVAKNSRDDQSCLVPTDVAGADCVPCGCYWTC